MGKKKKHSHTWLGLSYDWKWGYWKHSWSKIIGRILHNSTWKTVEIIMLWVPSTTIQRVDMSQVFVELKECLALEMAHGRRQSMAIEVNQTILSIPLRISLQ